MFCFSGWMMLMGHPTESPVCLINMIVYTHFHSVKTAMIPSSLLFCMDVYVCIMYIIAIVSYRAAGWWCPGLVVNQNPFFLCLSVCRSFFGVKQSCERALYAPILFRTLSRGSKQGDS
jgi:hypothetical protein